MADQASYVSEECVIICEKVTPEDLAAYGVPAIKVQPVEWPIVPGNIYKNIGRDTC